MKVTDWAWQVRFEWVLCCDLTFIFRMSDMSVNVSAIKVLTCINKTHGYFKLLYGLNLRLQPFWDIVR